MGEPSTWCLGFHVAGQSLALFETALEPLGGALVTDRVEHGAPIPVRLYLAERPEGARVTGLLATAAQAAGIASPVFHIEELAARDWVAESQSALPALRAGRFYLYGAHITVPPPPASLALRIEAGAAFGTGRHESTHGCLLALERLAKGRTVRRPLDLGCGSGVLAIAMAKLWPVPVLAVDNDPVAVAVTRENAQINGVAGRLSAQVSDGLRAAVVARRAPFDLIVANILAAPLAAMAPDISRHLAPQGVAVLSGLLASQERALRATTRFQGLRFVGRIRLAEWVTLVVGRGGG